MISLAYEEALYKRGFSHIAGVDEAGRGPLAGPVVATAVLLPRGMVIDGVDDSKKLSPAKRAALALQIQSSAIVFAYGIVDAETIDRINILQATLLAMAEAVSALHIVPDAVLVDGIHAPKIDCHTQCIPHGDRLSHSIAAASILAKTYRDDLMLKLHEQYPLYGFSQHKGYGTAVHRLAIKAYGLSPVHRKSFKVKV